MKPGKENIYSTYVSTGESCGSICFCRKNRKMDYKRESEQQNYMILLF